MKKKDKDKLFEILRDWNNRKLESKEGMLKIWSLFKEELLIVKKKSKKNCLFCGKQLPPDRLSYCDNECKYNDRRLK